MIFHIYIFHYILQYDLNAFTWSTWLYLAMSLCSVLSRIMATMPDRKRTMTKEFIMLCKHTKDNTKSTYTHKHERCFIWRLVWWSQWEKHLFIPKPLDVGVRHGDKDVVPPRSPLDRIVLLYQEDKLQQNTAHKKPLLTLSLLIRNVRIYDTRHQILKAYLKFDRVRVNNCHVTIKLRWHFHWAAVLTRWVFLVCVFDTVVYETHLKKSCIISESDTSDMLLYRKKNMAAQHLNPKTQHFLENPLFVVASRNFTRACHKVIFLFVDMWHVCLMVRGDIASNVNANPSFSDTSYLS